MNDSFLNSANAPYVAELFFKFKSDPSSVDKSWSNFFETFNDTCTEAIVLKHIFVLF